VTATTTILVTDVATSTELLRTRGDEAGAAVMAAHLRLIRDVVERHHGRVAKTLGDGVMALFGSAYDAARASVALQQEVERAGRRDPSQRLALRVGCHVGEVVDAPDAGPGDDAFGIAVVVAHRLCAVAKPGEIITSDLVRLLVGARMDVTFEPIDPVLLKGFDEPVPAARVGWQPLPAEPPTRVVVADDAALVRSGLVRLLTDEGFHVVGEAADADVLRAIVDSQVPDLVITDIRMPPTYTDEGLRAAAEIRHRQPSVAVLVLSQHIEARAAIGLLDDRSAGVGYLLKERVTDVEQFVDACRTVAGGGRVVDPLVSQELFTVRAHDAPLDRLTDRERDVLGAMAQGRSNAAIADLLAMSPKTVESHVRAIFIKLDLAENPDEHRRVAAVIRWLDVPR
jgi:DNA-binding NarL/FixJ family response regulator/class 3 adenylate cyclase